MDLSAIEPDLRMAVVEHRRAPEAAIMVHIHLNELLTGSPEFGNLVAQRSGALHRQIVHWLGGQGIKRETPVWLRIASPGSSPVTVKQLLLARNEQMVTFCGVVTGATPMMKAVYACTVVCPSCGREEILVRGEDVPECCLLGPMMEDPSRRILVKAKTIQVLVMDPVDKRNQRHCDGIVTGSLKCFDRKIQVWLLDDLVHFGQIGRSIVVTGTVRRTAPTIVTPLREQSRSHGITTWKTQINALGIYPLKQDVQSRSYFGQTPSHTLEEVIGLAESISGTGKSYRLPMLALLLSAASSGHSSPDTGDSCPKQQVHVAIASPRWDPKLARAMDVMMDVSRLGTIPVSEGRLTRDMLPRVKRSQGDEPGIVGGRLVEAAEGIVRLEAGLTPGSLGPALVSLLAAEPAVQLVPEAHDLDVFLTTSIWFHVCGADLGVDGFETPPLVDLLSKRYGPDFPSLFDTMILCDDSGSIRDTDGIADMLRHINNGLSDRDDEDNSLAHHPQQNGGTAERHKLARHLATARRQPPPRMTCEALEILTAYFTCLRLGEEQVPQSTLIGLARLASAAARLAHREEILPVPDAALAIVLMEERLLAMGMLALRWEKWRNAWLEEGRSLHACLQSLVGDIQAETAAWMLESEE